MLILEALELALSKEKEAVARYKKMEIDYPTLAELFISLANEELKHVDLLQEKMRELIR